jgi:hypothetical protein
LALLHRSGPLDRDGLAALVPTNVFEIDAALAQLTREGLVSVHPGEARASYSCETCIIPFGHEAGWEAAVLDHYQAMVAALVTKLRAGPRRAALADRVGGSTFVFDLWQGHPLQEPVLDYLKTMREHGLRLRSALDQHSASSPAPKDAEPLRVIAYVGQTVSEVENEDDA